jgi:hypothetical protein
MTLQEAIEEVKRQEPVDIDWPADIFEEVVDIRCATAIATILNAVVKGELK